MTDGQDETWSLAEMSEARRRPWSVEADCSTPPRINRQSKHIEIKNNTNTDRKIESYN